MCVSVCARTQRFDFCTLNDIVYNNVFAFTHVCSC